MPRGNGIESTQLDSQFPQLQVKRYLPWPQNPALAEKISPPHSSFEQPVMMSRVAESQPLRPHRTGREALASSGSYDTGPCPKTAQPPLESSALQSGDIAMLGWRGRGSRSTQGCTGTQRRELHAVAVLGLNCLSQDWVHTNFISP
jgi:hypothetical protein